MDVHLKQYDPYKHLVSSSFAGVTASSTWKLPEISFTQQHDYSGEDPARLLPVTYKVMDGYGQDKPVLLAEQGLDSVGASGQAGLEIVHFHNGIWAAPFSGYAGSSMYWWWDTYIDPRNLWGEYKGLADFLKDENLAPLAPAKALIAPEGATALALQGADRALVWVRSDDYTIAAARQAYEKARGGGQAPSDWQYAPPMVEDLTLTLSDLADGSYRVRWFSPSTAEWQDEQTIEVTGGTATLAVPPLAQDLAVQIIVEP